MAGQIIRNLKEKIKKALIELLEIRVSGIGVNETWVTKEIGVSITALRK